MNQDRAERLLEVGRSLVSELELEPLLEHILDVARDLTGAKYAAVGVLDDRREHLARFVTSGIDAETKAVIGDLPRGHGVLGHLISHPHPLRLDDVGSHPGSYGFPIGHPPMRSFLGMPVLVRGRAWGNLYLTEKAGGPFTDEDEETVGVLADWTAVAVDNAGTFAAEHSRRNELERGVAAYEATLEIARGLAGETDLEKILELVVKRGRALVHARSMIIELISGNEVVVVTTAGSLSPGLVGRRAPLESSLAGQVSRRKLPLRLSDLSDSIAFAFHDEVKATAGLFVPLLVRGRAIGALAAFDRLEDGPEFNEEDARLMEAFASSAANAVATAQTAAAEGVERAMQAAEDERRRWARELHDDTLQDVGALRVLLGAARQSGDDAELAGAVDEAVERLGTLANVLRSLINDLHPAALDKLGAGPAIDALLDRLQRSGDLEIHATVDLAYEMGREPDRHAPEVELAVYRIVQEALTNVVRHSGARVVDLEVREADDVVRIRVHDDGRGFDPKGAGAGFGLIGMRERLARVGGQLDVESEPGQGTTITAILPGAHVEPAEHAGATG